MITKNESQRFARMPMYLAMMSALSLGSLAFSASAESVPSESRITCADDQDDCQDDRLAHGPSTARRSAASVGILGGGFGGSGDGTTISTDGTATTHDNQDIAIGNGSSATGQAKGLGSVAMGNNAIASGSGSLALGNGAVASGEHSVALGTGSVADADNVVSLGDASKGLYRQLTQMAAGTADTDGVNVGQLKPVVTAVGGTFNADGSVTGPTFQVAGKSYNSASAAVDALDKVTAGNTTTITDLTNNILQGTAGLVQQARAGADITVAADKDGTGVDFTGTAGARTLKGVAAGTIADGSTDAVNGGQLFATNQRVTQNEGAITTISEQLDKLNAGEAGLVQQDVATGAITVARNAAGTVVDFTGTSGARKVSGVADGELSAASNEAVNGAQLNATNQQVNALDTRVTTAEGDITDIKTTITELSGGIAAGIAYDDPATKSQVTFGGAAGTLVTNVAPGTIATGSMDAINGGQLAGVRDQLQGQIGNLNDRMNKVADGIGAIGNFDGNMGNKPITNLADGVADTDAVNVRQLNQKAAQLTETARQYTDLKFDALQGDLNNFKGEVDDRFDRQDRRIDRIGAMSAANTQMAMNAGGVDSNRGRLAVGVGLHGSQGALAVGYATQTGDRTRVSFGGAFSRSEASIGAGFGVDL